MKNIIPLIIIILFSLDIKSQNLIGSWERVQENESGINEKQIVIFSSIGFQSISILFIQTVGHGNSMMII